MLRTLPRLQGFPPTWETCNESTSCRSIKWDGSNGRSLNSTTALKMFNLPVPKRSNMPAHSFVQLDLRLIDQRPQGNPQFLADMSVVAVPSATCSRVTRAPQLRVFVAPTKIGTSRERSVFPSMVPDRRTDRASFVEAVSPFLAELFGKGSRLGNAKCS